MLILDLVRLSKQGLAIPHPFFHYFKIGREGGGLNLQSSKIEVITNKITSSDTNNGKGNDKRWMGGWSFKIEFATWWFMKLFTDIF